MKYKIGDIVKIIESPSISLKEIVGKKFKVIGDCPHDSNQVNLSPIKTFYADNQTYYKTKKYYCNVKYLELDKHKKMLELY